MTISSRHIDEAKDRLADGLHVQVLGDRIDQELDRLVDDWANSNPVLSALVWVELLDRAASNLTASATKHDHLDDFIGTNIVKLAPMLRELLGLVERADCSAPAGRG